MRNRGNSATLKSSGRVTLHIFVKEPEGSSEKILKYVKYTYIRISVSSQNKWFHDSRMYNFPYFQTD